VVRPSALVLVALAGCVNNYVLVESSTEGDEGGASGGDATSDQDPCQDPRGCATAEDGGVSSGDPSSSSSSATSTSTGNGDPGPTTTMDDPGLGVCEICEEDAQCAGEPAFCVLVGEQLRCLRPCSEQEPPCEDGFTCESVQTSESGVVPLCVPVGSCSTKG
jgi:hypothetical protein